MASHGQISARYMTGQFSRIQRNLLTSKGKAWETTMNKFNRSDWEARRRKFWQQLEKAMYAKSQLHTKFRAPNYCYFQRGTGLRAVIYGFIVSEAKAFARVEVYLDRKDPFENDQIFDLLLSQRKQIESAVGLPLSWERLEKKGTSRIAFRCGADFSTSESWNQMIESLSDRMVKFERGFEGPLATITI